MQDCRLLQRDDEDGEEEEDDEEQDEGSHTGSGGVRVGFLQSISLFRSKGIREACL